MPKLPASRPHAPATPPSLFASTAGAPKAVATERPATRARRAARGDSSPALGPTRAMGPSDIQPAEASPEARRKSDAPRSPAVGQTFVTAFESNPNATSPFRFRATRMDGRRAPKVILSNDARIQCHVPCRVRVDRIRKPEARAHGCIEVVWVGRAPLVFDEREFSIDHFVAARIQTLLEGGSNILLDGPQGCGKTVLSLKVAEALGMRYVVFNCSAVYEPTDFVATLQLRASASGAVETVWVPTPILTAIEEATATPSSRWLVFLDEFNRCRDQARNGLLSALDVSRRLWSPKAGCLVPIPPNVVWVAATNSGSQFTGASRLDPAQLDRFSPVKMSYPPAEAEVRILAHRYPSVARQMIAVVVDVANAIRSKSTLRVGLSMRATEEVVRQLGCAELVGASSEPLSDLMRASFCGRFEGTWDDAHSEAGTAWKVVKEALNKAGVR
ncbi:MAG: MoxR family ATPase [Phycisphaerales bacterium]